MSSTNTFATVDEAVLAAGHDWKGAVQNVCRHLIEGGECFSSGEVARFIRMVSPDLRFSISQLGEYLRDCYFSGDLGEYENGGFPLKPVQVCRQTQGLFPERTPAGVDVFVYGPSLEEARHHDFEVYVPLPGDTQQDIDVRDAHPCAATTPPPRTPVGVSKGLPAVKVKADNRLYIPRRVVDAYCSLGHAVDGQTQVYVAFDTLDGHDLHISFEDNGGRTYSIWGGTGRVAVGAPDASTWKPGDSFTVTVDESGIIVSFT